MAKKKKNKDMNNVLDEVELSSSENQDSPDEGADTIEESGLAAFNSQKDEDKLISFKAYFFLKNKPSNYFTGMSRYTNVKIKRTFADWEKIFSTY